jgi:hypothetical protein
MKLNCQNILPFLTFNNFSRYKPRFLKYILYIGAMKRAYFILMAMVLYGALSSCKEIIEPSLTKRNLVLNAPADGYESTKYQINFWWNEVEDALGYRLQVVSGTFEAPGGLVLDTLVQDYKFAGNLDPGEYEWRVRAENGSSQTTYSAVRRFTVLQSSIKEQSVRLAAPGEGFLTKQAAVSFRWGSLYGATKYHLQVDTNSFADESAVLYDKTIPGQQIGYTLPKDRQYQWRVRAENDTAQARWSAVSQFTYDKTPPGQVTLTSPANDQTASSPVVLQWKTVNGAFRYKLYVLKSDSTAAYTTDFPMLINSVSYTFAATNPGERIYWKVAALDAAGNEGKASALRSFVLQ